MIHVGSIAGYIREAQEGARIPIEELGQNKHPQLEEIQGRATELLDFNTVELVTAVNAASEKEVWLEKAKEGVFTNPQLKYDLGLAADIASRSYALNGLLWQARGVLDQSRDQVEGFHAQLLIRRIASGCGAALLAYGMLNNDKAVMLDGSALRYGQSRLGLNWSSIVEWAKIGVEDIRDGKVENEPAQITIPQAEKLRKMTLDARVIAEWFRWAVGQYGFDYSVEVDTTATAIDVRETSATGGARIVIPASRKMHGLKLVTLIRHEIDCHARDSQNGRKLLWGLGGGALRAEDDVVYEGHAMTEENAILRYCTGESPRQALPWYVLALAKASGGACFADVARWIYQLRLQTGAQESAALSGAWGTTYRVFRGLADTGNPEGYAFWKDKAYLQGTLEVGDLYDAGLGHWAEIGSFSLDELVMIAQVARFESTHVLPYQDLNTAQQVLEKLLY